MGIRFIQMHFHILCINHTNNWRGTSFSFNHSALLLLKYTHPAFLLSRSTMFLASLLVLMTLLLPPALSGHQGDSALSDGIPGNSLEPSLAQTIQNLLLTRLGLQSYPNPRPGAVVPQYLLDLYRFHTQQYHLVEDSDFSFPVEHVQGANTVRSFHHAGKTCWSMKRSDYFIN